jgi:hypothetical protein
MLVLIIEAVALLVAGVLYGGWKLVTLLTFRDGGRRDW